MDMGVDHKFLTGKKAREYRDDGMSAFYEFEKRTKEMIEKSSPRLDAIRAMREATYEKATASKREMERAADALAKRKKEDIARDLETRTLEAIARSDYGVVRRKAKKAAKNSRRGQ